MEKILVCDGCSKVSPKWHHSGAFNSSKFCNICGTYVSEYRLTESEIKDREERHKKWVEKNGSHWRSY